ncbi:Gfo/Idh/MocA family protein [Acanthopleuribacter pedis]|uniref:Gfo/Idh/MocA family oxidoreductase n=1 Tax=Acanthopleuribacter pedis TaxID=442870 RepID=A0A8J7QLM5_9BACT|nr:Gfo/Idh/MocA family oxidoreductase [Acanthopleuribacter pedis]MBO1323441.1 Gfo/Idh/MocA family oxidoreductase [Acanthopleuribacter pedis]
MDQIRWGIIGAGRIARAFASDCQRVGNARVTAVAARDLTRAQAFAAAYAVPTAYGDYDSLFAAADVDAVYISTPHSHHLDQAVAAIKAGKHILCEKPLVLNPEEGGAMIDAARTHDVYLMEMMWTSFLPAVRQALAWVDAGRIGKLTRVHADFGYPIPYDANAREYHRDLGGGCLLEMGVYPVAFAWMATGRDPARIQASAQLAPNGVEHDVSALFDYGDGVTACLAASFRAKLPNVAYLIGESGWIAVPDFWRAQSCSLYHLEDEIDVFRATREHYGFDYQIQAACDDILAGRRENHAVPWAASLTWQHHMQGIRAAYGARGTAGEVG